MKKFTHCILLLILSVSCTQNQSNLVANNFNTKSHLPIIGASNSPLTLPDILPVPDKVNESLDPSVLIKDNNFIDRVKNKTRFDLIPPKNLPTVPGKLSIIYKNNYKVRIDKEKKNIKSNIKNLDELNNILDENNILTRSTSNDFKDDQELDRVQKNVSSLLGIDVPHAQSIHYYTFPVDTNMDELCLKLRKLPYVLNAYPTLSFQTNAAQLVSRLTTANNGYYSRLGVNVPPKFL